MTEEERNEYLDRYLDGKLNDQDKAMVEGWLQVDQELGKEIEELKGVKSDLHSIGISKNISDWESSYRNTKPSNNNFRTYLAIAASVAILAVAVITLLRPADKASLYTQFYSPYNDMVSTRGEIESTLLQKGMAAYNEQDYLEAAEYLGQYVSSNDEPLAWLYLGISHLEMNEYEQAILALGAAGSSSTTSQQSEWYTGLTHLKSGDKAAAVGVFRIISSNPGHYKQKEASQLLDELD